MQWPFSVFVHEPVPHMIIGWAEIVGAKSHSWAVSQVYITDGGVDRQADFDERIAVLKRLQEFGPQINRAYRETLEPAHDLH